MADPPPREVTAIAGNGRVTVSWEAPYGRPDMIAFYDIQPWIGDSPQPTVRVSATATAGTVTGLANGSSHRFYVRAISTLGTKSAWSEPSNAVTPAAATAVAQVDAGYAFSCAIVDAGSIECWGANDHGQLGRGVAVGPPDTPAPVAGITDAVALSSGQWHSCAVLADATARCWGSNGAGQLGNGTTSPSPTPATVVGLTNVAAISTGEANTCALLATGSVKCWGDGFHGQLGNGANADSATPVTVTGITDAVAIDVGTTHSCAVRASGTVVCWGENGTRQLGNGTVTDSSIPVPVMTVTGAVSVAASNFHSCAVASDGSAWCWGLNTYGRLGNGTTTGVLNPVSVVGLSNALAIALGEDHSCALRSTGAIACWGYNGAPDEDHDPVELGQLGNGTTVTSSTPVGVSGISNATGVDAGSHHSCAVLAASSVQCWGWGSYGQLGDGGQGSSTLPIPVAGL
ncbi:MAG: fibronectin type III domain-containing protein [Acidimicrobiales bacterium]